MKRAMIGLVALAVTPGTAFAQAPYDRSLEQAAIRIVAAKVGPIRDGYAPEERPSFVPGFGAEPIADEAALAPTPAASPSSIVSLPGL